MASSDLIETPPVKPHQPVWPLAELYPYQGEWSEEDYLNLHPRRLIEFADGFLEFPPMPTITHQRIAAFLFTLLHAFLNPRGGEVLFAPVRLRTIPRHFREPDLVALRTPAQRDADPLYLPTADLVIEIVSADDPERDYVLKRSEYAGAGVAEYWIVDPERQSILVLGLRDGAYCELGHFAPGQRASSAVFDGFGVDVRQVFAAAEK